MLCAETRDRLLQNLDGRRDVLGDVEDAPPELHPGGFFVTSFGRSHYRSA